jgi:hypothetical protein
MGMVCKTQQPLVDRKVEGRRLKKYPALWKTKSLWETDLRATVVTVGIHQNQTVLLCNNWNLFFCFFFHVLIQQQNDQLQILVYLTMQ